MSRPPPGRGREPLPALAPLLPPPLVALVALPLLAACNGRAPDAPVATSATPAAESAAAPPPVASSALAAPGRAGDPAGVPCGALDCRLHDRPEDAFAVVLATKPLALGLGEAHAQRGLAGVDSSAKRFTTQLLPLLQGRASDLVVELMLPPQGCKKIEKEARATQREVTKQQAETNQSEYVGMNEAARKLGVVPDALRPSCADLDAVNQAGEGSIARMLEMIARLAGTKGKELVARNAKAGADRVVVLYGGALHNDAEPKPERASWSFGPELARATGGRYVELDLFVPEAIQDTESWKAMPWYPHYDRAAHAARTALFKTGPASWALVFPRTARP